jgi:peptide/nickel transport system ATP-binding protein
MNTFSKIISFDAIAGRQAPVVQPPLLSVNGLRIATGDGRELVHDVQFDIPHGATLGIVGESGSGKSLTCRAILGVLPPGLRVTSGSVVYKGADLSRLDREGWRGLRGTEISAVFQDPSSYLNPSIPVGVQLAEALRAALRLSAKAARDRALALMKRVGLRNAEAVYRQYPFELSGGMAQRILIAIAVCAEPKLLIADEATTALDVTVQAGILELLGELRREKQLTLIMVSHDLAVVSQACDHIVVMRDGAVVEAGPTQQVLRSPAHPYTRSLVRNYNAYGLGALSAVAGETRDKAPEPRDPEKSEWRGPLLSIRGLQVAYGDRVVVDGIDLDVDRGEIVGLIGETGSGKTTVLRSILGLVAPKAGSIRLEQDEIAALRGQALRDFRRASRLQYVFQDSLRSLDPDLTIGASIGEGLDIRGGIKASERDERVAAALTAVGLDPALSKRLPRHLSGGQRQRAAIARALILQPLMLLLDEPVSALDAASRVRVLELLGRLAREQGISQIFISHDLGSVAGIADKVAVLYRGRLVEAGPTHQVLSRPSHPYTRKLIEAVPAIDREPVIPDGSRHLRF